MKRIMALLLMLVMLLAGCAPQPTGPAVKTDFNEVTDFSEYWLNPWENDTDLIRRWAAYAYENFSISDVKAYHVAGAGSYDMLRGNVVEVLIYHLTIEAEQPIPNAPMDEEGRYLLRAAIAAVGEKGTHVQAVGVLPNIGHNRNENFGERLRELLAADENYAADLLPDTTPAPPEGTKQVVPAELLPDGVLFRNDTELLEDGTTATVCYLPISAEEAKAGVLFWSPEGGSRYVQTDLTVSLYANGFEKGCWQLGDNMIAINLFSDIKKNRVQLAAVSEEDHSIIKGKVDVYPDGRITAVEENTDMPQLLDEYTSPDGSCTVWHTGEGLMLQSGEMLLKDNLIEGPKNAIWGCHAFVGWLDNSHFVFSRYDKNALTIGVYDVAARRVATETQTTDYRYLPADCWDGEILLEINPRIGTPEDPPALLMDASTFETRKLPGLPDNWTGIILQDGYLIGCSYEDNNYCYGLFDIEAEKILYRITLPNTCNILRMDADGMLWRDHKNAFQKETICYWPVTG